MGFDASTIADRHGQWSPNELCAPDRQNGQDHSAFTGIYGYVGVDKAHPLFNGPLAVLAIEAATPDRAPRVGSVWQAAVLSAAELERFQLASDAFDAECRRALRRLPVDRRPSFRYHIGRLSRRAAETLIEAVLMSNLSELAEIDVMARPRTRPLAEAAIDLLDIANDLHRLAVFLVDDSDGAEAPVPVAHRVNAGEPALDSPPLGAGRSIHGPPPMLVAPMSATELVAAV